MIIKDKMIDVNQALPNRVSVVGVTYKSSPNYSTHNQNLIFCPLNKTFRSLNNNHNRTAKVAKWEYK